jgi:hypothetical protein
MIPNARLSPGPGFKPLQAFLYYIMRLLPYALARRVVSRTVAGVINLFSRGRVAAAGTVQPAFDATNIARELRTEGCVSVPPLLAPGEIADIRTFLASHEVITPGGRTFRVENAPKDARRASYPLDTIVRCPHVLEAINRPDVIEMATRYLGCRPTISAVGLHWSLPSPAGSAEVQKFHRDPDDWYFLKMFIYLTDVDEGCGPHEFVRGTHRESGRVFSRPYQDAEIERRYGADAVIGVVGAAGTTFFADTWGIHKGRVAVTRPRLNLQVTYSVLPVFKLHYRPILSAAAQRFDAYTNRLLIR